MGKLLGVGGKGRLSIEKKEREDKKEEKKEEKEKGRGVDV
jgi:hypothetical protein